MVKIEISLIITCLITVELKLNNLSYCHVIKDVLARLLSGVHGPIRTFVKDVVLCVV